MTGIPVIREVTMMILPLIPYRLSHRARVGGPVLLSELGQAQSQLCLFRRIALRAAREELYQATLLDFPVFPFIIGQLLV